MGTIEDMKDKMTETEEVIEAAMRKRAGELKVELDSIQEALGEKLEGVKEEVYGFVNKIKANIKPILIGVALFAAGVFAGSLSSIL